MGSKRLCLKVVTELGVGRGAFCACVVVCYCVRIQVTAEEDVRREWVAVRASDQRMVVAGDGARREAVSSTRYVRLEVEGGMRGSQ